MVRSSDVKNMAFHPKYLLFGFTCFFLIIDPLASLETRAAEPHPNTWSIVALDERTGDVGAAAASCFPGPIVGLAALVPGNGVAVAQADFSLLNRNQVFEMLKLGIPAKGIVARVTSLKNDPQASTRQYGVVTITNDLVQVAGYTGSHTMAYADDRQRLDAAVSVQGNFLVGEEVIDDAMVAFQARDKGPLALPDRLMRALEAGSAAGGDLRCDQGIQQTASTAFIVVLLNDQEPFAAPFSDFSISNVEPMPWLLLSVTVERGGPNPIVELRRQYDVWRAINLPPCPTCDLQPIPVPPGITSPDQEGTKAIQDRSIFFLNIIKESLVVGIGSIAFCSLVLVIVAIVFVRKLHDTS